MRYQKKQTWKKRMVALMALLMAVIMVLGLVTPLFAATPTAASNTTAIIQNESSEENSEDVPQSLAQEVGAERFSTEANVGFDGSYIVGCTTPFHLSITNLGEDFEGELQIKTYLYQDAQNPKFNSYALYTQKLSLAANATKGIDLELGIQTIQKNIEISLIDKNGTTVFLDHLPVKPISPESTTIGIVSEQPASLRYLENMHLLYVEKAKNHFFFLDANTFPKSQEVMKNFQMLVIDDFDTKTLSAEQQQALQGWLNNGGVLVLGTGVHAQKVLSGLDFLGIQQQGSTQLNASITSYPQLTLNAPLQLSQLSAKQLQPIWTEGNTVVTSLLSYGNGQVFLQHFAMDLAPFADASGNITALETLYTSYAQGNLSNHDTQPHYMITNTSHHFEILPLQNLWGIFAILVVYIILIGPVLYFVLKKKDQKTRGWIYIPICSVVFVAIVFLFGTNSAYKSGLINSAAIVSLQEGSNIGQANAAISIKSPKQGDITLSVDNQTALQPAIDEYTYRYPATENGKGPRYRIETGDQTDITFYHNMAWENNTLQLTKSIDMGGEIESTVQYIDDTFVGTLTNHSNVSFEDTVLSSQGMYVQSGPLPAGESIKIDIPVTEQMRQQMYNPESIFFGDESALSLVHSKKLSREKAYRMQQQSSLLESCFNSSSTSINSWNTAQTTCTFYGFSYTSMLGENKAINGKPMKENNITMYQKDFTRDLSCEKSFDLPFTILPKVDPATQLGYNYETGGNRLDLYGTGSQSSVSLYYPIEHNIRIDEIQFRQDETEGNAAPAEIYNNATQTWEVLADTPYTNPYDYIDQTNQIQVRFYVIDYNQVPNLRVKGGGLNA